MKMVIKSAKRRNGKLTVLGIVLSVLLSACFFLQLLLSTCASLHTTIFNMCKQEQTKLEHGLKSLTNGSQQSNLTTILLGSPKAVEENISNLESNENRNVSNNSNERDQHKSFESEFFLGLDSIGKEGSICNGKVRVKERNITNGEEAEEVGLSSHLRGHEIAFEYPPFSFPKARFIRENDELNYLSGEIDPFVTLNYCWPHHDHKDHLGLCFGSKKFTKSKENESLLFGEREFTTGRILTLNNFTFTRRTGCSNYFDVDVESVTSSSASSGTSFDKVVFGYYPLAWQFQHFVDGALPKFVQMAEHLKRNPDAKIIFNALQKVDPMVFILLKRLFNIDRSQLINVASHEHVFANHFIWPCKAPNHPYLWRKALRLVQSSLSSERPASKGEEDDKTKRRIIWISRNGDKKGNTKDVIRNAARRIPNEDELLQQMRDYLVKERNSKEELTVYPLDFPGVTEDEGRRYLELWGEAVVIIGVHGGGLYNQVFAPKGCLVIELMPFDQDGKSVRSIFSFDLPNMFANFLQHKYWRLHLTADSPSLESLSFPSLEPVLQILRESL